MQHALPRCFNSRTSDPWNFNFYLWPAWLLGVIVRYVNGGNGGDGQAGHASGDCTMLRGATKYHESALALSTQVVLHCNSHRPLRCRMHVHTLHSLHTQVPHPLPCAAGAALAYMSTLPHTSHLGTSSSSPCGWYCWCSPPRPSSPPSASSRRSCPRHPPSQL